MKITKKGKVFFKNELTLKGKLTTFHETGMESLGLVLELKGKQYEEKNDRYTPDGKNGPKNYISYNAVIFLKKGDILKIVKCKNKAMEGKTILVGNLMLAKENGFRLSSYPYGMKVPEWLMLFDDKTIATVHRECKKIAYYGGSFDPIHMGHKYIIEDLHNMFDLVLVSPITNWLKEKPYLTDVERKKSVEAVCHQYPNVKVYAHDEVSTYKAVRKIEKEYGYKPQVVIGSDCAKDIDEWKDSEKLRKRYKFLIFKRGDLFKEKIKIDDTIFPTEPWVIEPRVGITKKISSTEIKKYNRLDLIPPEARPILEKKFNQPALHILEQNNRYSITKSDMPLTYHVKVVFYNGMGDFTEFKAEDKILNKAIENVDKQINFYLKGGR